MLLGTIGVLSAILAGVICAVSGGFASLAWLWILPVSFVGGFVGLFGLFVLAVWLLTLTIPLDKEQKEESKFYRCLVQLVAEAAPVLLNYRVHTQGMEQKPKEGRFLLVCNHLFDLDPVILTHEFRGKHLAFISKRENQKLFIVGRAMLKILCQPINRENDREALKTIVRCIQIIREDKASIAVFPEGYVSADHKCHPFRPGVFKIAQKTNVPIVVCTLTNTHKILPNFLRLKRTHVDLHLVGVVQPEEYAGITTVELADRIHAMMTQDLGEN